MNKIKGGFLFIVIVIISIVFLTSSSITYVFIKHSKSNTSQLDSTAYYKAICDTLTFRVIADEKHLINYENERKVLADSIAKLNYRPLMTKTQFLELYNYERLLKYYKICKKNPSQWKYYKGWSIRVFEE